MIYLNKKHCLILLIVFFVFYHKVDANVVINEIEILPTTNRFIELYNSGTSAVSLTGWYIQRKTATGSEFSSLISKTYFEGKSIEAGGYFLISKSLLDNSNIIYDGLTITESNTIQIKNANQEVVDKVSWGDSIDCNTICGQNPSENKSIGKISSNNWLILSPTPGLINNEIEVIIENNNTLVNDTPVIEPINVSVSSGISSPSSINTIKKELENPKIITKIISKNIAVANVPFDIDHQTIGYKKEKIILGRFFWNFGDGMTKNGNTSEPFKYIYEYPGDYVLTLSYYSSIFDVKPESVDRMTIRVIPSGINISSIGTLDDAFIEIENNSNYEIALYKWNIKGSINNFIIPEGMIILPNKKLKLSPKVTGFNYNDLSSITITNDTGEVFANYPTIKIITDKKYQNRDSYVKDINSNINPKDELNKEIINLNDLGASVANSGISDKISTKTYSLFGLAGIIILGIICVIMIRRKDRYGDYIENNISAKDMTIIE